MSMSDLTITPTPTDEEAAAIAAAVLLGWPEPAPEPDHRPALDPRWRFSGRWWSRPIPMSRQRPWRG
jgi:hypothetical protein